ncbi:hypothetical protein PAEPH01_1104 [Pancytospora epiphaga]|nr:hypothetical protein PAEPH01_1104 [Pancytospora epiphaga]
MLLYSEVEKKSQYERLCQMRRNELVSIKDFSMWLKHGNIYLQDEMWLCYLQDRNMFKRITGTCPHCKKQLNTVDYLDTQCDMMLYHDYTQRHNKVVQ